MRRLLFEDVVLGYEMACTGMKGPSKERGENKVGQGMAGGEFDESNVEEHLDCDVEEVDPREGEFVNHHGAEGVEEDLEGAEEGFAKDRVEEESLEGGGEVGIEAIYSKRFVVR